MPDTNNPKQINSFLVSVTPIFEDGKHGLTETAMHVAVSEGKLKVLNTDNAMSIDTLPIGRVIRRKLAPKSGNQLFVS